MNFGLDDMYSHPYSLGSGGPNHKNEGDPQSYEDNQRSHGARAFKKKKAADKRAGASRKRNRKG